MGGGGGGEGSVEVSNQAAFLQYWLGQPHLLHVGSATTGERSIN